MKSAFDTCFEQMKAHLTEPQKKKLDILKKKLPMHFSPGKDFKKRHGKHRDHSKEMKPPDLRDAP